jgi:hypothetical protein
MIEQILPWVGFGVLLLLCLPIPGLQKLVLEVTVWGLRLAMLGLLAGGAYLWFRPGELPAEVSAWAGEFPRLLAVLPERGTPAFALCAACWVVAVLVPVLAVADVARRLAARRLAARPRPALAVRPRAAVASPATEPVLPLAEPEPEPEPVGVPVMRPIERRAAAAAIASAGSRNPR